MLAQVDPAWFALIGALGGVFLISLFSITITWLTNRSQRKRLLAEQQDRRWQIHRDERRDVYLRGARTLSNLIDLIEHAEIPRAPEKEEDWDNYRIRDIVDRLPDQLMASLRELDRSILEVSILGSYAVGNAFRDFRDACYDYFGARLGAKTEDTEKLQMRIEEAFSVIISATRSDLSDTD